MKQEQKADSDMLGRFIGRVEAEKKKAVFAFCLVAMMVFMWVRVLTSQAPQPVEAMMLEEQLAEETQDDVKVSFIELPVIKGRNDVLTKDFFAVNGESFENARELNIVSMDDEAIVRRIADRLILEAISSGPMPQAFINNKLLSVGDKLTVADGDDRYECEVIGIEGNVVIIRFDNSEIKLRLTQVSVTD